MAHHTRSNSLPSKSHPIMDDVVDHLCRLKSSEATSTSATGICANLARLRELREGINNLIQMPSIQQALSNEQGENWMNELLEGSLRRVDFCGFARDVVCLTMESVQELESPIRRNRGETASADDINAYVASRKKINKMVNRFIKNLKSSNRNSTAVPDKDCDLKTIRTMLNETEALDFSVLKSVLVILSGTKRRSKQRNWSFLSKSSQESDEDFCLLNIHKSRKVMDNMTLKQLKATEMCIQELEEGLEALFRSLVKTRVSLLNVLSH